MFPSKSISQVIVFALTLVVLFIGCTDTDQIGSVSRFESKEAFGEALFFDPSLSLDSSISCASCHVPEKAFTDARELPKGFKNRLGFRNAPTLINVKNMHAFMFDGRVPTLEMQAIVPIQDSNEMNMSMKHLVERLQKDEKYANSAKELFNRELDAFVITRCLAAYQRTITSKGSPFDNFLKGEKDAISPSAQRGYKIFSEKLYCIECHSLPDFTNHETRNNGYMGDTLNDQGRYRATGLISDKNKFKTPTLRNIAITGPYMHDGKLKTLSEVIANYEKGGAHYGKDKLIRSFRLSKSEKEELIHFFESLTDTAFISTERR